MHYQPVSLNQVIPHIIDQHGEEAAFLWLLRDAAIKAPHYSVSDLADLDERVEAHLDGLRIAGEYGWEVCLRNLELKEPGEVFAATVLALTGSDKRRIEHVYTAVSGHPELSRPLISGIGWVDSDELQGIVSGLLKSEDPFWRGVGLGACSAHRVDPGKYLESALDNADPFLKVKALKAAARLGRSDLKPIILSICGDPDPVIAFWSAWSSVLLGDRGDGLQALQGQCLQGDVVEALGLILRVLNSTDQNAFLKTLASDDSSLRYALVGAGVSGDPIYIPWLIKHFESPILARVAGEAFSLITGVDLAYDDLEKDCPEGFEAGPTENPQDGDTSMDDDEDLPWPDAALVSKWWSQNSSQFNSGTRYLLGEPVSESHCREVLLNGKQRQRHSAALELALMSANAAVFETRSNGRKQKSLLSIKRTI